MDLSNTAIKAAETDEGSVRDGLRPRDFFELMKPRVMSLVIFTALVGLVTAPGKIGAIQAGLAVLCIALGAGASGALNMWYDADIDAVMHRTARRPVPEGRISPREALIFGLCASMISVTALGLVANWAAAGLLAFTIFFYVVIYTMWLKRSTPQNIVIGGAAGAFPPMVGWVAVSGDIGLGALVLFLIIFLWTPPHFWALALYRSEDYARAGVPMMPVVAGGDATRRQILAYSLALVLVAMLPWTLGHAGLSYALGAGLLGMWLVYLAARLWWLGTAPAGRGLPRRLFGFSILYLFVLFALLLVEQVAGLVVAAVG